MSVHRPKGSRYWHYDFWLNGGRFRKSTKATTKRAALKVESDDREAILEGAGRTHEMTLEAAAERYYQERAQYQPTAADTDRMSDRLIAAIGDKFLSQIGDDDVAQMVARRRGTWRKFKAGKKGERKPPRLLAPATVNRETELLRRIMRKADLAWKVTVARINWAEHLLREPEERIRELTAAEEAALFGALRPDFHAVVRFCLLCGARLGSAIRLTWDRVDHAAGVVTLKVKGERTLPVPMTSAMRVLLANERGKHPIFVFTYQCRQSRIKRRQGERYPFSKNGWRRPWMKALAAAKVTDFRFHDTRHTAATRVLRSSRNLKVVQKMLGHTDIATTARYAHVTVDDVRQAMEDAERSQESPHSGVVPPKQNAG